MTLAPRVTQPAHPVGSPVALAAVLAAIAGYVDALSYLNDGVERRRHALRRRRRAPGGHAPDAVAQAGS
jgi:hypothetical protein